MKIQLCHPEIPKFPSAKTPRGNSLQKREKVEREREVEEEKRERERESSEALMAEGKKERKSSSSEESVKLFVGQVPKHMTEAQLLAMFQEFALVDEVNIIKDKVTRVSRGFGPFLYLLH